ncbi:hypothetical protein SAMN05192564_102517 [Paraburkholderia sartisoli]|uniref:Uncharacterized protein n=1 Tax=Paraburkholderia sartisoli TaxID=83784 RepID=A0A1H4CVQ7_9BURK|nr:hypothetical protein SAMN05192564_102517 [Paraburkholderia sartisoli]
MMYLSVGTACPERRFEERLQAMQQLRGRAGTQNDREIS